MKTDAPKRRRGRPRGKPKPLSAKGMGPLERLPNGWVRDRHGRIFEEYINEKNQWDLRQIPDEEAQKMTQRKKQKKEMVEITPCKHAGHPELQTHPYNAQNILLVQQDFPAEVHSIEELACVYQDRVYTEWREGIEFLQKQTGDKGFHWSSVQPDDLKKFASIVCADWLKHIGREVTGVRVVRYTNVASGYPCLRLDVYSHDPANPEVELYSDQITAPNILSIEEDATPYGITIFGG